MRLLILALCAALSVTSLAAAQSNHQRSEEKERSLTEHPSTPPQFDIVTPEQERVEDADGVCYTMRSYIFERRDTEAPHLVGTVTCTRSSQRQFKRAKRAPKPKLIPAD
jgi:hypothetical protein